MPRGNSRLPALMGGFGHLSVSHTTPSFLILEKILVTLMLLVRPTPAERLAVGSIRLQRSVFSQIDIFDPLF